MADYRPDDPPGDNQALVLLHHNASDPPHQSIGQKICVNGHDARPAAFLPETQLTVWVAAA